VGHGKAVVVLHSHNLLDAMFFIRHGCQVVETMKHQAGSRLQLAKYFLFLLLEKRNKFGCLIHAKMLLQLRPQHRIEVSSLWQGRLELFVHFSEISFFQHNLVEENRLCLGVMEPNIFSLYFLLHLNFLRLHFLAAVLIENCVINCSFAMAFRPALLA